jgi:uncharacterized protein YlbG (UPF0298 family)
MTKNRLEIKTLEKIDKRIELIFLADVRCNKKIITYFELYFRHVNVLDVYGKTKNIGDNDKVDLRVILTFIDTRISPVEMRSNLLLYASQTYPYVVLFVRQNNIDATLPIMEVEIFVEKYKDKYKDIKGYFSKDKNDYPNGTYGLLEYHSLKGPQEPRLRDRNEQCIEYMKGIIENRKPRKNMTYK